MLNVPAGTHRVRFEREGFYTFEKEMIWRAGHAGAGADRDVERGAATAAAAAAAAGRAGEE